MLKFILCWLQIEYLNILTAMKPPHKSKRHFKYFAFGANVNKNVLINRRRIRPITQKNFVLKDHALTFGLQSAHEGVGYGTIIKKPDEKVYGKLYDLSEIDAKRMDFFEGVFIGSYHREFVTQDDETFYYYGSKKCDASLRPTQEYVNKIINGLEKEAHVPKDFIDFLKAIEVGIPDKPSIRRKTFFISNKKWLPKKANALLNRFDRKLFLFFIQHVLYKPPSIKLIKTGK